MGTQNMSDILQEIYVERVVKAINQKKEVDDQILACANCTDLHKLCSNANAALQLRIEDTKESCEMNTTLSTHIIPRSFSTWR